MNEKDLKNLIDIPNELDNVINIALEKGKEDKAKQDKLSNKKTLKKVSIAASLLLCSTVAIGTLNPDIASAFPTINKVFETFNTSLFGESTKKFQDIAQAIGKCTTNNGASITLNEAVLDDNVIMLALTVESDFLKTSKADNEQDFFYFHQGININGQSVSGISSKVKKINDTTGYIILTSNLSEFDLDSDADVELNIFGLTTGLEVLDGQWNFSFNLSKESNGKRIIVNPSIKDKDFNIDAVTLTMSDLTNTIKITGNSKDVADPRISSNIIVKDNNNKYFLATFSGSSCSNNDHNFVATYEIKGDLSNSESIEIIAKDTSNVLEEEHNDRYYTILKSTGSSEDVYERQLISRKPTEKEINAGYAALSVDYYVNIDKNREFKPINELINSEIKVSSTETIKIKNVETTDEYTKIFFETNGLYNYVNFAQTVIFDESMNDTALEEDGYRPAIEDINSGLFSIKLRPIDTTKKYKIAVPMIPEINENESYWKVDIPFN